MKYFAKRNPPKRKSLLRHCSYAGHWVWAYMDFELNMFINWNLNWIADLDLIINQNLKQIWYMVFFPACNLRMMENQIKKKCSDDHFHLFKGQNGGRSRWSYGNDMIWFPNEYLVKIAWTDSFHLWPTDLTAHSNELQLRGARSFVG